MVVYARENVFPTLTNEAKNMLKEFYVQVQDLNDSEEDPTPATPRRLEAGIRLSVAFARAELSDEVLPRHAERAINISKHVVGHNFDPETGKFDSARTGKGTPKSQKERIDRLKEVVRECETTDEPAMYDDVVDKAVDDYNMSQKTVENELDSMYDKGEWYEPRQGEMRLS